MSDALQHVASGRPELVNGKMDTEHKDLRVLITDISIRHGENHQPAHYDRTRCHHVGISPMMKTVLVAVSVSTMFRLIRSVCLFTAIVSLNACGGCGWKPDCNKLSGLDS